MIRKVSAVLLMAATISYADHVPVNTTGNKFNLQADDICYFDTLSRQVVCTKSSGEKIVFDAIRTHATSMHSLEDSIANYIGYYLFKTGSEEGTPISIFKQ